MKLTSPQMPYAFKALEPAMSRETLWFHFARHQRTCFEPAIALIRGTELDRLCLEEVILRASSLKSQRELFHHAAGLWNHQMFWQRWDKLFAAASVPMKPSCASSSVPQRPVMVARGSGHRAPKSAASR